MRSKRILAAATAALATAATGTAFAADDGWHVDNTQTQSGHTIHQSATGRILATQNGMHTVLADCKVRTSPPAIATGLEECYLLGANGQRFDVEEGGSEGALPGPVATAGALMEVPAQRYRMCVQGAAYFQDQFSMEATLACTA